MVTSASPLELGIDFSHFIPIPADAAQTTYVDGGPLRIGVEYRVLDIDTAAEVREPDGQLATGRMGFADRGFCLHVYDRATGLEHLRFDIFDDEPHYHYMMPGTSNIVVVFDSAANGDMLEWTISCLEKRLSVMLVQAGAVDLAKAVNGGLPSEAIAEVLQLVRANDEMAEGGQVPSVDA